MDRAAIAQIIDPTAWKLDSDGYLVEMAHSADAFKKADQICAMFEAESLSFYCDCAETLTEIANLSSDPAGHWGLAEAALSARDRLRASFLGRY